MEGDQPVVNAAPEVADEPAAAEPAAEPANGAEPAPAEVPAAAAEPDAAAAAEPEAAPAAIRLTVSGLLADCKDEDVKALFEQYASLKEVEVQRTGEACAGTATVVLGSREDAEAAVAALDGHAAIPSGSDSKLTVRLEDGGAAAPAPAPAEPAGPPSRRVFWSGCPPGVRREDVEEVLSFYGPLAHLELYTTFGTRETRGCGWVVYKSQQAAEDAVAAMHGAYTFPGGAAPMTVKWLEPEVVPGPNRLAAKRKWEEEEEADPLEDRRQLFVAKITRSVPEEDIKSVLAYYGTVTKLQMFKPTPDAVYHKGCGVVTYSRPEEAEAACMGLDGVYTWPEMKEPMVAKYNESDANRRKREDEMRSGPQYVSLEQPPQGCDMDVLKLYVANIPAAATVDDLQAAFKGFGKIIQILVARDKATGQHKGTAYIWFQRRRDADLAVKRLNGTLPAAWEGMGAPAEQAAADGGGAAAPKPPPLIVSVAQSSVKQMRRGDSPPEWMRALGLPAPGGAPPPFRPPMGGPPPGYRPPMGGPAAWGAPPAAAPGAWGAPPSYAAPPAYAAPPSYGAPPAAAHYGAPPAYGAAPAAGGYGQDPYASYQQQAPAQQGGYAPTPAGLASPGAPAQAAPAPAYGGYAAAPQPGVYAAAPTGAAPAYQQPAAAAPQQQGYYQQAPVAGGAPAGYGAPQQAQQPVGGYGSYPGAAPAQQAPQQQYGGGYGGGY